MHDKPSVLIVTKEPILPLIKDLTDYTFLVAENAKDAIAKLRRFSPGVVLLDCLDLQSDILSLAPLTKMIVVSQTEDRKSASKAILMGAFDYVAPLESQLLQQILIRAFYLYHLAKAGEVLGLSETKEPGNGWCASMQKVALTIQKIAPSQLSVLLQGESGTGKEVLARQIHEKSNRANGPFVAINCAAIPETLLESELFGFEKGAFTGAHKLTIGRIERAHKGTLFLDEIGDLPLSLQPKLLRFLQEKVIERLGGSQPLSLDVRVICATHQNLQELMQKKMFRDDLYYRLCEITLSIPPLRERQGDALTLARLFLQKYAQEFQKPIKKIAEEALLAINQYTWPGNVRELENKIKRAVILAESGQITSEDLDLPLMTNDPLPFNLKQVRDKVEREHILNAMRFCEGNISKTAEVLGITRPTLYNLMEKLNISEELVLI